MLGWPHGLANAEEADKAQLDAVRKALAKYEDPYVAVRDLYLSTVACVHFGGEKMEGHMDYPKGAMGVHFVNLTIGGPPDPMKPNVLIYEPDGNKLRWLAPNGWCRWPASRSGRPCSGQPFQGPMEGHEPLIPQGFHHYDLHVWLFKDNPDGHVQPHQPECELRELGFCPEGNADQAGARTLDQLIASPGIFAFAGKPGRSWSLKNRCQSRV